MLSRRLFLGSVAAVAAGANAASAQGSGSQMGQVWAGLELVDAAGQAFRLSSLKPRLKLFKLWANWCPGCLIEMPSLVSLAEALGRDNLDVVLISNPDDFRRDQAAAQRFRVPFRLATPSSANRPDLVRAAMLDRDGAYVVPRALLFAGPENTLTAQLTGSRDWSGKAAQWKAQLG